MKLLFSVIATVLFSVTAVCQAGKAKNTVADAGKPIQVVEVSCGKCKLGAILPAKPARWQCGSMVRLIMPMALILIVLAMPMHRTACAMPYAKPKCRARSYMTALRSPTLKYCRRKKRQSKIISILLIYTIPGIWKD